MSINYLNKNFKYQIGDLLQILIIFNFIIFSYQASHIHAVKSHIKNSILHDSDVTSLLLHSHELKQIPRDIREIQTHGGAQPRHVSSKFSHRRPRNGGVYFTPWTHWSNCDKLCKQKRERFCIRKRKCGETKHVEERICPKQFCSTLPPNFQPIKEKSSQQESQHTSSQTINFINYPDKNYHTIQESPSSHNLNDNKPKLIINDNSNNNYNDHHDHYIVNRRKHHNKKKRRKPHTIDSTMIHHDPQVVTTDHDYADPNEHDDYEYEGDIDNFDYNDYVMIDRKDQQQPTPRNFSDEIVDLLLENVKQNRKRYTKTKHVGGGDTTGSATTTIHHENPEITKLSDNDENDDENDLDDDDLNAIDDYHHGDNSKLPPAPTNVPLQHQLDKNYGVIFETVDLSEINKLATTSYTNDDESFEVYADRQDGSEPSTLLKTISTKRRGAGMRGEKNVVDSQQRYRRVYYKWSRWSKCSTKCTTRRFKRCRLKEICGNEVLRETAYCYVEGTFCQEWIKSQMHNINTGAKPIPREPFPIYTTTTTTTTSTTTTPPPPPSPQAYQYNNDYNYQLQYPGMYQNQIRRTLPQYQESRALQISNNIECDPRSHIYAPHTLKCGIPTRRRAAANVNNNWLKIIGGKPAGKGTFPWQVAVLNKYKEVFCGGTLISSLWVLSAAHCVRRRLYVKLGVYNLNNTRDRNVMMMEIAMSIKHPEYNKRTVDNDIAMLKLPESVTPKNNIGFACLPQRFQHLPTGTLCTIIGWGKMKNNDISGTNVLHAAEVPIISNDECKNTYSDYKITKNMFCAGHKRGRIDTCAGDSGGPILCRDPTKENEPWTIFGVTSFGDGCGKEDKFGIYTKLPNYIDWIWSVVNCNGYCNSQCNK